MFRVSRWTVVRQIVLIAWIERADDAEVGIADSLITRLGNIRQVIVRPTSSVRRYIGLEQDPVVAGRELEVESVLEGSIRESGERIRVTVQLVSVSDRSTLWADKFDEKLTDIFAVEDSISERVAEALRLELTGEERKRLTKRYTENAEAYQLYLRGRYHWNKRAAEELRKGIEHFQQAIDGDPNYALAWAGLADCYVLLSYWGGVAPKDCLPKAKAAALRAVELDDHLAEAHASLAMVKRNYEWDFPGTEGELRRALELKPHYATAHHWYGDHLTTIGRLDEGMAELRRAQELDPLSLVINSRIGLQWLFMRRYTEAVAAFQSALDLDPRFYPTQGGLGLAYAQTGRHEEATSEINKARALTDAPHLLALLGITYALSGRKSKARQVIAELQEVSQRLYVSPYHIAWVYAALGEKDHAFTWLEQAYEDRTDWLLWVKVEPLFDCLRADPRFADLVRRVGLEP